MGSSVIVRHRAESRPGGLPGTRARASRRRRGSSTTSAAIAPSGHRGQRGARPPRPTRRPPRRIRPLRREVADVAPPVRQPVESPASPAIASAACSAVPIARSQCGKRTGPNRACGTRTGRRSHGSLRSREPERAVDLQRELDVRALQAGRRDLRPTGRGEDEVGGEPAEIVTYRHKLALGPERRDRDAAVERHR